MTDEQAARLRKVMRLSDVLWKAGAEADDIEHLPDTAWRLACDLAHCRYPSDETKALVAENLRLRSRPTDDPFDGL